jgi:hypothetical protein
MQRVSYYYLILFALAFWMTEYEDRMQQVSYHYLSVFALAFSMAGSLPQTDAPW